MMVIVDLWSIYVYFNWLTVLDRQSIRDTFCASVLNRAATLAAHLAFDNSDQTEQRSSEI